MDIYEPREDSHMLVKWVRIHAKGKVLDMGTGSGIQALAAFDVADSVLAVDINENALKKIKNQYPEIKTLKSDLFKKILEKFDTIIFNPPYLPQDEDIEDISLYGGKEGFELLVKFLRDAKYHLNKNGILLFLFSSLTGKKKIDSTLNEVGYEWIQLDEKSHMFEKLYVYLAKWNT